MTETRPCPECGKMRACDRCRTEDLCAFILDKMEWSVLTYDDLNALATYARLGLQTEEPQS